MLPRWRICSARGSPRNKPGRYRPRGRLVGSCRNAHHDAVKRLSFAVLAILLLCGCRSASGQSLFDDDSVLEIVLSGPLHSIIKNRKSEIREEKPFKLTAEGVEHNVQVRLRGKSRIEACVFPPLKINFKRSQVAGTLFAGQDKLKLVTHCSSSRFAEADVLEEFAAYKILNVLTDTSFRVRELRIRYIDTDGRVSDLEEAKYGFLIESKEQLAERNGGSPVEKPGLSLKHLNPEYSALVYVFQYLIGNTDWSLAAARGEEFCCHNVTLVEIDSRLNPVPYDFDMSGLVNARYALPDADLRRISKVTQRLYRGYCTDQAILRETLLLIRQNRENIIQIINELPLLTDKQKKQKIDFLEKTFGEAEKEDKLIKMFEQRCLGT